MAKGTNDHTHTCSSNGTNCTFSELHCGENYTVTVATVERGCQSQPSTPVNLRSGQETGRIISEHLSLFSNIGRTHKPSIDPIPHSSSHLPAFQSYRSYQLRYQRHQHHMGPQHKFWSHVLPVHPSGGWAELHLQHSATIPRSNRVALWNELQRTSGCSGQHLHQSVREPNTDLHRYKYQTCTSYLLQTALVYLLYQTYNESQILWGHSMSTQPDVLSGERNT